MDKTTEKGQKEVIDTEEQVWLSCVDMTEWQKQKMLENCIEITSQPYQGRSAHAVKCNVSEVPLATQIVEQEDIICVRK